jgi:hypothetical protein
MTGIRNPKAHGHIHMQIQCLNFGGSHDLNSRRPTTDHIRRLDSEYESTRSTFSMSLPYFMILPFYKIHLMYSAHRLRNFIKNSRDGIPVIRQDPLAKIVLQKKSRVSLRLI